MLRSPESAPSIPTDVPVLSDKALHPGDADSGLKTLLWSGCGAAQGHPLDRGSYSGPLTPALKTLNPKVRFHEPLVTEETTASQNFPKLLRTFPGLLGGAASPSCRGCSGCIRSRETPKPHHSHQQWELSHGKTALWSGHPAAVPSGITRRCCWPLSYPMPLTK